MVKPFIPTPYTVTRIRRTRTTRRDVYGDEVWEESVDAEQVAVAGWAAPHSAEPKLAGHDRVTVDIELFAPTGAFTHTDAVELPGVAGRFEVVGLPENYSHSPFGWDPGLEVVNLAQTTS